ncbi:sulfite exporter TauE/SafE family protein [Shewanella sp. JNE10-2]|uniref:sulfite exporter TauE/SafE family protein n=1 Tax=unclassified Shewanella TaxID=196818 RepID=UPI0020065DFA|nr:MULTISPECIES: sulfite exporter TauE/SafE family protein [unclassified Shewanella]MCK7628595.1 sulfite exporter TauE/SafE family protein [Shewanella sp. JNE9-1]MCK7633144.1 sulfite exporter TauE/SafE family protein [Shewanella sp. JNE17]MCK7643845.1 sulfite exporter TauE/SafE family protein [Shewanella sp. JNE3-1]MCK7648256.1 sulfite exporter TauE/SafE family protein [Shewanella sp. JNE8]MCK7651899.1 sulfite exporter TauE/SafE family protein [Shewanella sp. JNE4-1]
MDWLMIALAGFLGGMLNAVAGGGSFITLLALVFVGVPPIAANATGTAALLPGYIASAWRFRKDIEYPASLSLKDLILIALIGGSIGAGILLTTSEQVFAKLIPWLILLATAAFIVGPWLLKRRITEQGENTSTPMLSPIMALMLLAAVCIYGGYFNGGLGIILLASFGLMGQTNLHGMNGLKNLISALLTTIAVVIYAAGDAIDSQYLLLLAVMAIIGGYVGAAMAYRISQPLLRGFIVIVGLAMALGFFIR